MNSLLAITANCRVRSPVFLSGNRGSLARHFFEMLAVVCSLAFLAPGSVRSAEDAPQNQPNPIAPAATPAAEAVERRMGRLIKVPSPITDSVKNRVVRQAKDFIARSKQRQEWPVVIFEIEPGASSFGSSIDLAKAITELSGATTVAYVSPNQAGGPNSNAPVLRGHAVLVAIACEIIVLPSEAKIGEAGADENNIPAYMHSGYADIAKSRRTVAVDLVLGMLDPALEVYEARTADQVGREFVRGDRLEELRQQKQVERNPTLLIPSGEAGLFTAQEGKRIGLVDYYADDFSTLAKVLSVPPDSVVEDPSLGDGWKAVEVEITEPLTRNYLAQIQNKIDREVESGSNLIILRIDSPGGAPEQAAGLAARIADLKPGRQRTVAYIPQEAGADAAFLALACDHILMHPHAKLGGRVTFPRSEVEQPNPFQPAPRADRARDLSTEISATSASLDNVAKAKGRSASLWQAIVDPNLAVFRYVRESDGMVAYYSEVEAAEFVPGTWQQRESVTQHGKPLEVEGTEALHLGMATDVVNGFGEVLALYGLESPPRKVSPSWADTLLDALRDKRVLWALLLIGGAAFYAELQTPGTGIGGFIATVCFLLFFWGNYLEGTAGWLELLLFIAGMTFLLLEIFVLPGFGIFGVGGGMLVLAALVLALQTSNALPTTGTELKELRGNLFTVTSAAGGVIVLIALLRRYLPRTRGFNRLVLAPPGTDDDPEMRGVQPSPSDSYQHLIGNRGVAVTPLRPSGKVRIGTEVFSVVSNGEPVNSGEDVIVVEAQGNRIVVRPDN